ncbi:GDP-fucose protein O-fucosyltransferase 2-like [Argonauta hians]
MDVYVANLKLWRALPYLLFCYIIPTYCHNNLDDMVFQPPGMHNPEFGTAKRDKYLLYDVNHGEGFNLRRDVYMRIANLAKSLNQVEPWVLVLPPWGNLYHWQTEDLEGRQIRIPWSLFFDVNSLSSHVPTIEFDEFLSVFGGPEGYVDQVYYLQHYKEGWTDGKFEEKIDERECLEKTSYKLDENNIWRGWFFGYYDNIHAKNFKCLSVQGHAGIMKPILLKNTTSSVLVDRAENLLHDIYGDKEYWRARRSMVFAKELRSIGDKFRAEFLNSTDETDRTIWDSDWRKMIRKERNAFGGPYLAVHLRRKDYLRAHKDYVPTLKFAAKQIRKLLKQFGLEKVFIASDDTEDVEKLRKKLRKKYEVYNFAPSKEILAKYMDGGVAIIDQWICAHARYFIGTHLSTFSFRIQEEREILGFKTITTFNRLCKEEEGTDCEQPSKWTIVY